MARQRGPDRAGQPDAGPPPALQPGAEPGRDGLAVPARALAEPPRPRRRLRGSSGPSLRRLERPPGRNRPPSLAHQLSLVASVCADFVSLVLFRFCSDFWTPIASAMLQ